MNNLLSRITDEISKLDWQCNSDDIIQLISPCIRISNTPNENIPIGQSKFGGLPDLPASTNWPCINNHPLVFLCQIDFSEISDQSFVPNHLENQIVFFFMSCRSEDYRDIFSRYTHTAMAKSNDELIRTALPSYSNEIPIIPQQELVFKSSYCIPSIEHHKIESLRLSEDDEYLYTEEVYEIFNEAIGLNYQPGHMLFGHSDAIQGDTGIDWSSKQLGVSYVEDQVAVLGLSRRFNQLLQIDFMRGFDTLGDGCLYYGYTIKDECTLHIEGTLQNT